LNLKFDYIILNIELESRPSNQIERTLMFRMCQCREYWPQRSQVPKFDDPESNYDQLTL